MDTPNLNIDQTSAQVNNRAAIRERLVYFGWLGFCVGGIGPLGYVFFLKTTHWADLVPPNYDMAFSLAFLFLVVISVPMFFIGHQYFDKRPVLANNALRLSAFVSLVVLHVIVLSTGGSISSFFSYHYLYIPAVIAISLPVDKDFYLAALCSAFSFTVNLFCVSAVWSPLDFLCFKPSPEWDAITKTTAYRVTFFVIFLIQVTMLVKMRKIQSRLQVKTE